MAEVAQIWDPSSGVSMLGEPEPDLQEILTLGLDRVNRRIWMQGDLDQDLASQTVRLLHLLSDLSEDPIELWISTWGGSMTAAQSVVDAVRYVTCEVITVGTGPVASAGAFVFLAGDTRLVTPQAELMIHGGIRDVEVKREQSTARALRAFQGELRVAAESVEWTNARIVDALVRVGMDARHATQLVEDQEEHWFRGAEIVAAGFAHEVLSGEKA